VAIQKKPEFAHIAEMALSIIRSGKFPNLDPSYGCEGWLLLLKVARVLYYT